jgi:hypothetical protein
MSDPDRAVDRQVRLDIQARGYHVGIVPAVPGACGWAFSVGLPASADHPEVIAFGPDLDLVGGLVQRLCEMVRAGQDFSGRERHGGVLAGHDVATRPLAPKWTSRSSVFGRTPGATSPGRRTSTPRGAMNSPTSTNP